MNVGRGQEVEQKNWKVGKFSRKIRGGIARDIRSSMKIFHVKFFRDKNNLDIRSEALSF